MKLRKSNYLFLGYTIADWRLRVFLSGSGKVLVLGAKYWAVEREPDALERRPLAADKRPALYRSSLTDYLQGLYNYLDDHPGASTVMSEPQQRPSQRLPVRRARLLHRGDSGVWFFGREPRATAHR